jgi:hypothetical protein
MYFSMYLTADHLNETLFDEFLIFYIMLCCFGEKKLLNYQLSKFFITYAFQIKITSILDFELTFNGQYRTIGSDMSPGPSCTLKENKNHQSSETDLKN